MHGRLMMFSRALARRSQLLATAFGTALLTSLIPGMSVATSPLPILANWSSEAGQDTSFYGWDVNTAGDVNGDGFSDVLVGAKNYSHPQIDLPGHIIGDGGLMRLYLGSAEGVRPTPAFELKGNGVSDEHGQIGFACQTAGDVNGDGYDDIMVSEPKRDTPGSPPGQEGRVFLYLGGPTGLDPDTAWTFEGVPGSLAELGNCVGTAGDVNGDGYDDVLVSAQDMNVTIPGQGRVYAFYGSANGLPNSPSWIKDGPLQSGNWFGMFCHGVGDVNGDGYDDVGISSIFMDTYTGQAWIFMGGPAGLDTTAAWTQSGAGPGSLFGGPINRAGDVNGDGYADVIIGESRFLLDRDGQTHLYLGGPGGLATSPIWTVTGALGSCFGLAAGTAGDVNGDGYADLIVGAPDWVLDFDPLDDPSPHPGHAYLYLGSPSGPSATPAWNVSGDDNTSTMGRAVAAAGDVNGDGFGDVIVSAAGDNNGNPLEGAAYVYHGRSVAPSSNVAWSSESNQVNARHGTAIAPAGDVNADGYTDVLVGAPLYDNGYTDEGRVALYLGGPFGIGAAPAWTAAGGQTGAGFGTALSGIGDVNGDGYADVLIGAPSFTNDQVGEGRATLYLGGPGPAYLTETWSAEGDQVGAHFGQALAMIGDVNGDGHADAAVGAPDFSGTFVGEGRVRVFTGSAYGLSRSAIWSATGGATGAGFGGALAGGGDLNGDGYSDLVIGSPSFDGLFLDEGRVQVWRGGVHGLEAAPWFAATGAQADEGFGRVVASAGDIDGDGFSDLLASSPGYAGIAAGEGRIQIWRGGSLSLVPFDDATGGQAGAAFGAAMAAVPDLNGDGFGDLLIGAPGLDNGEIDEGRIEFFLGSASGIATSPDWTFENNQAGAAMGSAVAAGGDFTGDGFPDILAGAPGHDAGQTDEGRSYAFFGNGGRGVSRLISQLRVLSGLPVSTLGSSDMPSGFRLHASGRSPNGRSDVRLVGEVRPLMASFTGSSNVTTPFVNSGVPSVGGGSAVDLLSTVSGLDPRRAHHWRLRIESRSPFFPRGPWFSQPYNAPSETDFVTGPGLTGVPEPNPAHGQIRRPEMAVFPNPMTGRAVLRFTIPEAGPVRIQIFDVAGRTRAQFDAGRLSTGTQTWVLDVNSVPDLPPGTYLARATMPGTILGEYKFTILPGWR